jgi:hypothetical protein
MLLVVYDCSSIFLIDALDFKGNITELEEGEEEEIEAGTEESDASSDDGSLGINSLK